MGLPQNTSEPGPIGHSSTGRKKRACWIMPPFLYRCPNTGDNVQGWAAEDPEDDDLMYIQVTCLACAQAHLVNPKTGKVLGSDDE